MKMILEKIDYSYTVVIEKNKFIASGNLISETIDIKVKAKNKTEAKKLVKLIYPFNPIINIY